MVQQPNPVIQHVIESAFLTYFIKLEATELARPSTGMTCCRLRFIFPFTLFPDTLTP